MKTNQTAREIKFRAWRKPIKANGEVYDGEMYYSERGDEKRFVSFGFYHDSGWGFDDFIFMLNTGLKDKHGKEVYEGDIISMHDVISSVGDILDGTTIDAVGEVKYIGSGFYLYNEEGWMEPADAKPRSYEVIGNIYENPGLLGVNNE
jgi:uncharacterized phage protein (TIGR01671 family)